MMAAQTRPHLQVPANMRCIAVELGVEVLNADATYATSLTVGI